MSWTVFLVSAPISGVAPPPPNPQLVQYRHRCYLFLVRWNSPEKLRGAICFQILFASQTVVLLQIPLPETLARQFPLCVGCSQSYKNNVSGYVLKMRWAGPIAHMEDERGLYRVLVGYPEGKRPLGRPRRRWEDNIKMDLQKVWCGGMDWIELDQGRDRWRVLVNAVMNLRFP